MASQLIPMTTTFSQITPQPAGQKPATPAIAGWFSSRGVPLRRRRKVPTVRLGGKKTRRGFFLVRLLRRVRVRWLRLKNSCMLKKLKDYYHSLVQDLIDGGGTVESFQQRLFLETSFGVPVMGLTFNTFPNAGSSLHVDHVVYSETSFPMHAQKCFTTSAFIKAPSSLASVKSISKAFCLESASGFIATAMAVYKVKLIGPEGEVNEFEAPDDAYILDSAENAGLELPYIHAGLVMIIRNHDSNGAI
ncbi:hypothetical protein RJ639_036692 [Escallonia herrerae]|uniref:Uncharacterized protein n=1 Tax=Escallonia herrerae TaxID=1293975 RepID=A0AA88WQ54_9ASTE|nr:hypothetical protein RJ639_036692 [Escallonia herrerae]